MCPAKPIFQKEGEIKSFSDKKKDQQILKEEDSQVYTLERKRSPEKNTRAKQRNNKLLPVFTYVDKSEPTLTVLLAEIPKIQNIGQQQHIKTCYLGGR